MLQEPRYRLFDGVNSCRKEIEPGSEISNKCLTLLLTHDIAIIQRSIQGLLKQWPQGGPKKLWQVDILGKGFSTVAVANDLVYVTGDVGGKVSSSSGGSAAATDTRVPPPARPVGNVEILNRKKRERDRESST